MSIRIAPAQEGHIYYDLKMTNPFVGAGDGVAIPFVVKDNASRILTRQDEYKMAITGFQLDLDVPLMVIPIEEGITQTDPNLTLYNVAIREVDRSDGRQVAFGRTHVVFVPENDKDVRPKPPSLNNGVQDLSNDYYTYQSYQSFVDIVNNAISFLINQRPEWATAFNPTIANPDVRYPVIEYHDQLFSIRYSGAWVTDETTYNGSAITPRPSQFLLEFSAPLKHLFGGFKYTRLNNGVNFGDGHNYFELNLKDNTESGAAELVGKSATQPEGLNSILLLKQEFDTRFRLNSISSLIITSDYIKVRPEYYPSVSNPNEVTEINSSFNTPYKNIISSFSFIDQSGTITWQEQQYYVPSVLKYIDLTSSDSLDVIDARVFYQLKRGGLIPANVPVGSQSTIKFLFRKKTALGD